VESKSDSDRAVRALIQRQRRLANSPHLTERFRILWVAAQLDQQLACCSDREISGLIAIVRDRFHIFEPEFGICEHAHRRLLLRTIKENHHR
jgi:hypothetical protein